MKKHLLTHVTLMTGHVARTPRTEVLDQAIAYLAPVAEGRCHDIPEVGLWIDVFRPKGEDGATLDGTASFSVSSILTQGRVPFVHCVACWDPVMGEMAWAKAEELGQQTGLPSCPGLKRPDRTPWLAVAITPNMFLSGMQTIGLLGDLERCMAWTLIEQGRRDEATVPQRATA